ncbi:MAG: hypothetical protein Q8L66_05680 [Caulobacter sp.]|nr:hypothetical protein [Caulobacter sp.]
MSTVQRAYALARSGQFSDVDVLKDRLKADGYRAVDALLAARSIRKHLEAICAATFKPVEPPEAPAEAPAETPATPTE